MKTTTPQSLPEGVSSSAGMNVSTAAAKKACSAAVKVRVPSADAAAAEVDAAGAAGEFVCASADDDARLAATAVPAPTRKSRRKIGLSSFAMASLPVRCCFE